MSASFPTSTSSGIGLTLVIAVILLASNFTVIDAQQQQEQLTSQPEDLGNGITTPAATIFHSANDSFRIQIPDGWIAHDINNSTSAMTEETRLGYGLIAQLCSQEEQQQGAGGVSANTAGSTNNDNTSSNNRCQGAQEEVIHIIRYPDLDTRLLANNVTTINNNSTTTTDNIISYQLQKLQEVGYRSMRIVITTDMTVNLTNPFTNETVTTLPAKLVEITYGTNFAPNEIRRGYFVTTATNATAPNPGDIKGYSVFYEGNSTATNATTTAAIVTPASTSLPAPTQIAQVFDSFELLLAPELVQVLALQTAQSAETAEDEEDAEAEDDDDDGDDNGGDDDDGDDNGGDDDDGDDNGGDDDDGDDNGGDDDGGDLDDCTVVGGTSPSDDCDMTPDDNGGGDDDGGDEGEGNEGEDKPNEFDDCTVTPG